MDTLQHDTRFQADLYAIANIPAVPRILDVVCRSTGMGFAAVARVTEDRWIACGVQDNIGFGLQPGGELKVETTICHEVRGHRQAVIIDNVAEDPTYCNHHTPAIYGIQSYISMPIILPDDSLFGTLCAIDPRPNLLNNPETIGMFTLFAELIAFHIDAHRRLAASEASLVTERQAAELRDQFIAVLGHDLRNPLASISGGMRLIRKTPLNERATSLAAMIDTSVWRMAGLIDNVLDFARGRLGGGVSLHHTSEPLEPVLHHVVDELRIGHPDRMIDTSFEITRPVSYDAGRLSQLLSNLLANALTHGAAGTPVRVRAITTADSFELSVHNSGDPIPPAALEKLFQPFERGAIKPSAQGLGLGLYIAAEIARAHGGSVSVASSQDETAFTFRMPLA